jgi:hypothetical protein
VTTLALPPQQERPAAPAASNSTVLLLAGVASLGAGAVHAAAAGAHGGHAAEIGVFTALAVAQLGWGAWAVTHRGRLVAISGVLLGAGALLGWALAKTVGIPLVAGLDVVEPVTVPDALAAVLAACACLLAASAVGSPPRVTRAATIGGVALLTGIASWGTVACASHQHTGDSHLLAHTGVSHAHAAVARPYDPSLPIDLGGTAGVTPQQQAAAENLVVLTLARLPQWADADVALRAGFHSIGDGFTGTEHLINTAYMHDSHVLDPDHPESLVYDTSQGGRRLVAAMYMVAPGTPLTQVPKVGGALVQWHIHDNLCYSRSGYVQGLTDAAGRCPAGQVKPVPTPMVHVWIVKHACGPFAALEGIGAGSIAPGQTRLCDHAHASTP